jgi:hypothetical protein
MISLLRDHEGEAYRPRSASGVTVSNQRSTAGGRGVSCLLQSSPYLVDEYATERATGASAHALSLTLTLAVLLFGHVRDLDLNRSGDVTLTIHKIDERVADALHDPD